MKEITVYEVDGFRFDQKKLAEKFLNSIKNKDFSNKQKEFIKALLKV